MLELLVTWLPPILQVVAVKILKGGWKWTSWLGLVIWAAGWFVIFYINLACFLSILFYLVLFAAYGITRAVSGKSTEQP